MEPGERHSQNTSQGFKALLDADEEVSTYQEFQVAKLGSIDASLSINTTYDKKTHLFSVRDPALDELFLSLGAVDPNMKLLDQTWEDVVKTIEEAEVEDELKASRNKMRGLAREGEWLATALKGMTAMIPDEKGLSLLRGGLSFLFSVSAPQQFLTRQCIDKMKEWAKRIRNRNKITKALGHITRKFASSYEKLRTYPDDQTFSELVAGFWGTLFEAVPQLCTILLHNHSASEKPSRNFVKSTANKMFKSIPSNEEAAIEEILDRVYEANERVSSYADSLDNARSDFILRNGRETLQHARYTHRQVTVLEEMVSGVREELSSEIRGLRADMARENKLQALQVTDLFHNANVFHNALYRLVADGRYQELRAEGKSA